MGNVASMFGPCKDYRTNHGKGGLCRCNQCLGYEKRQNISREKDAEFLEWVRERNDRINRFGDDTLSGGVDY